MPVVHGIVVHQTASPTAQSSLNGYAVLKWLIQEITMTLKVPMTEIYRHPDISYKQPSEAASAQW